MSPNPSKMTPNPDIEWGKITFGGAAFQDFEPAAQLFEKLLEERCQSKISVVSV